jgi:hypothetical protein
MTHAALFMISGSVWEVWPEVFVEGGSLSLYEG